MASLPMVVWLMSQGLPASTWHVVQVAMLGQARRADDAAIAHRRPLLLQNHGLVLPNQRQVGAWIKLSRLRL